MNEVANIAEQDDNAPTTPPKPTEHWTSHLFATAKRIFSASKDIIEIRAQNNQLRSEVKNLSATIRDQAELLMRMQDKIERMENEIDRADRRIDTRFDDMKNIIQAVKDSMDDRIKLKIIEHNS